MTETLYSQLKGLRVTTDTRDIKPGDLFIALKGASFDGNLFAADALEQGATFVVVDRAELAVDSRYIVVEDGLRFLQQFAAYHRQQFSIPVIAITGTNGKTTTKELCHAVLGTKYNCLATIGNLNNHIGVPLTLLRMDASTQIAIIEMGANHPGEIEELCRIADPDFGLITNIGRAHLEGFGSYENIITTKCELYRWIEAKNGALFVNSDDELLTQSIHTPRTMSYGTKGSEARGELKQQAPLVFDYNTPKGHLYIKTQLIGGYNFANAMAAVAMGHYFGVDDLHIKNAIENYAPSNMRSQLKRTEHNLLIVDAYNANPSSMQVAVSNFRDMMLEHKIMILGEMRELGENSRDEHEKLVHLAGDSNVEMVLFVGASFTGIELPEGCQWFSRTEELAEWLKENTIQGASVLIKGSRGNRLEQVIELL
ncbi:MAG: UDP-N-acetylmuramoyl-tripeptide--D-alanyl-D-alanine ligase [Marinifilaceae bacterium]